MVARVPAGAKPGQEKVGLSFCSALGKANHSADSDLGLGQLLHHVRGNQAAELEGTTVFGCKV